MILRLLTLLLSLLVISCGKPGNPSSVSSGVRGVLQQRFLPNPVNGGGAKVSVTPLSGEKIVLEMANGTQTQAGSAVTDAEGRFAINTAPGEFVVIYKSPYKEREVRQPVSVEPGKMAELVLETVLAPP
ncbi:MAG TPA: hypothetical protein VHM91_23560 [Verrucomicrobiales bacterium]|jgi:hypothetical protein|nr:hypothetical protein [Verrucomicrobiales bacterium]